MNKFGISLKIGDDDLTVGSFTFVSPDSRPNVALIQSFGIDAKSCNNPKVRDVVKFRMVAEDGEVLDEFEARVTSVNDGVANFIRC